MHPKVKKQKVKTTQNVVKEEEEEARAHIHLSIGVLRVRPKNTTELEVHALCQN